VFDIHTDASAAEPPNRPPTDPPPITTFDPPNSRPRTVTLTPDVVGVFVRTAEDKMPPLNEIASVNDPTLLDPVNTMLNFDDGVDPQPRPVAVDPILLATDESDRQEVVSKLVRCNRPLVEDDSIPTDPITVMLTLPVNPTMLVRTAELKLAPSIDIARVKVDAVPDPTDTTNPTPPWFMPPIPPSPPPREDDLVPIDVTDVHTLVADAVPAIRAAVVVREAVPAPIPRTVTLVAPVVGRLRMRAELAGD